MAGLLALDGATDQLALALVPDQGEMLVRDLSGGAQASAQLLPAIQALLREAGVDGRTLQGIAFGRGPGAFTGLRAICAVVQGLALGWELQVLPVDSLLLVAEDAAEQAAEHEHWGVVMDARMGELYAARYRRSPEGWETVEAPALYQPAALLAHWLPSPPQALCGSGTGLLDLPGLPTVVHGRSRAAALGRLCRRALQNRASLVDPALAMPLYVRDKVALTTAEREARAAQAS